MDGQLRSYISSPASYLLSVARASQILEAHARPEEPPKVRLGRGHRVWGRRGCWRWLRVG